MKKQNFRGEKKSKESIKNEITMGVFSLICVILSCFSPPLYFLMDKDNIGTININGGRGRNKPAMIKEMIINNKLGVVLMQETHPDVQNEQD